MSTGVPNGCFSFDAIVNTVTEGSHAESDIGDPLSLLLRAVVREAPLWVVLSHPARPADDSRKLVDAIDKLFARAAHATLADDADSDIPHLVTTGDTARPTGNTAAEDEETALILKLLDAHSPPADGAAEKDGAITVPTSREVVPGAASTDGDAPPLIGARVAQSPFAMRWASLGEWSQPSTRVLHGRRVEVRSVAFSHIQRSPAWYTALLRPCCEAVLDDRLRWLEGSPSHAHGQDNSTALSRRWYASCERLPLIGEDSHNAAQQDSTRAPVTVCFVLVQGADLGGAYASAETCAAAVRQVCTTVRLTQREALLAAAGQVVDRRVPLTLPVVATVRPAKRRRPTDTAAPSCAEDTDRLPHTGLIGWATQLKAEAVAAASSSHNAAGNGGSHSAGAAPPAGDVSSDRRKAWQQEIVAGMPHGMGCILLLPRPAPDASSDASPPKVQPPHGARLPVPTVHTTLFSLEERLRSAVSLNSGLSTFLVIS